MTTDKESARFQICRSDVTLVTQLDSLPLLYQIYFLLKSNFICPFEHLPNPTIPFSIIRTSKMARAPQNKRPAATSTELSTLNSTPYITRSITSHSTPHQKDPLVPGFGDSTDAISDQTRDQCHQVKATLTNILNDDRVKHNPSGSRCVQNILLENEQDMRKQRRHSLNTCSAKRTI